MFSKPKKAQSTLEYALLIAVVVGVLITMQAYIKRGMQGKLRDVTDQIGDQYSPGATQGRYYMNTTSESNEIYTTGYDQKLGTSSRGNQYQETNMNILPFANETFPAHWNITP